MNERCSARSIGRWGGVLILFLTGILILSCSAEHSTGLLPPPFFGRTDDDIDELWPNADGDSWTFEFAQYFSAEGMPDALAGLADIDPEDLDFRDIERRVMIDFPRATSVDTESDFQLRFNGMTNSAGGRKQALETVSATDPHLPKVNLKSLGLPPSILNRIWLARPDLRSRLEEGGFVPSSHDPAGKDLLTGPLFENSFRPAPFEKKGGWIGYYGDVHPDSSFTIVKGPAEEGTSFRHQLARGLADNIWEYGAIVGERSVDTPAGRFDVIRVAYFFDFGESDIVGQDGETIGSFHSYSIAIADFAPGVGPVHQRGYDFLIPPIPELGIGGITLFHETKLIDYDVPHSPLGN